MEWQKSPIPSKGTSLTEEMGDAFKALVNAGYSKKEAFEQVGKQYNRNQKKL